MKVLRRYKYAQIRVFRPIRRNRRTLCVLSCTVLLFGLFTLLLEIFNTSDRYRTLSMVPYSGNLSDLREHHLVASVLRADPVVQDPGLQFRDPGLQRIDNDKIRSKHINNSGVFLLPPGHLNLKYSPSNSTHKLSIFSNTSKGLPENRLHPGNKGLPVNITTSGKKGLPDNGTHPGDKGLPVNITSSGNNASITSKGDVKKQEIKAKPKSKYLSYQNNFTYPLEINLTKIVNNSFQGLEYTKHKPINPHNFWYLHKPNNCGFRLREDATKNVLVLVKSFVGNVEQRVALRTLWKATNDTNMRRVFMLGYHKAHQLAIDNESRKYRDIIQENFIDDYMNNTYKTIMAYNWAVKYCRRAHVILFLDDDYLVNMTTMAAHVRKTYQKQSLGLYTGTLAKHAPPYRDKNERWYLTFEQYPYDEFPPYVGGGAYVISFDVAKKFKIAFPYVQYMGIDDVYLGIVARKLGIEARHDPYLDSHSNVTIAKECSHNATELLHKNCTLGIKKKGRTFRRIKHKPVNAVVFVVCFCLAVFSIVLLSCCLSD